MGGRDDERRSGPADGICLARSWRLRRGEGGGWGWPTTYYVNSAEPHDARDAPLPQRPRTRAAGLCLLRDSSVRWHCGASCGASSAAAGRPAREGTEGQVRGRAGPAARHAGEQRVRRLAGATPVESAAARAAAAACPSDAGSARPAAAETALRAAQQAQRAGAEKARYAARHRAPNGPRAMRLRGACGVSAMRGVAASRGPRLFPAEGLLHPRSAGVYCSAAFCCAAEYTQDGRCVVFACSLFASWFRGLIGGVEAAAAGPDARLLLLGDEARICRAGGGAGHGELVAALVASCSTPAELEL
ncbi:uncharacterized protein V1518DRAFT_254754 [Limtongia smithiae]|uniref:uncharacterized protein n=1 Tax=Limtongia smithiae TaxID=1125753 RepID=UPI0034CD6732